MKKFSFNQNHTVIFSAMAEGERRKSFPALDADYQGLSSISPHLAASALRSQPGLQSVPRCCFLSCCYVSTARRQVSGAVSQSAIDDKVFGCFSNGADAQFCFCSDHRTRATVANTGTHMHTHTHKHCNNNKHVQQQTQKTETQCEYTEWIMTLQSLHRTQHKHTCTRKHTHIHLVSLCLCLVFR